MQLHVPYINFITFINHSMQWHVWGYSYTKTVPSSAISLHGCDVQRLCKVERKYHVVFFAGVNVQQALYITWKPVNIAILKNWPVIL